MTALHPLHCPCVLQQHPDAQPTRDTHPRCLSCALHRTSSTAVRILQPKGSPYMWETTLVLPARALIGRQCYLPGLFGGTSGGTTRNRSAGIIQHLLAALCQRGAAAACTGGNAMQHA
eukprot:11632786-Prorocentrum_lima.AAC.1